MEILLKIKKDKLAPWIWEIPLDPTNKYVISKYYEKKQILL